MCLLTYLISRLSLNHVYLCEKFVVYLFLLRRDLRKLEQLRGFLVKSRVSWDESRCVFLGRSGLRNVDYLIQVLWATALLDEAIS